MRHAFGQHLLRRAGAERDSKAGGIEVSTAEYCAQALWSRQERSCRRDLQGTPLDQLARLEHHGLCPFPDSHPATAAEQEAQVGTYQNHSA
jgi:hypothetical protein